MSAPVDVLSVLTKHREDCGIQGCEWCVELDQVIAAMTELIEAVEDGIGYGIVFEDAAVRERIRAALARVRGAA